LTSYSKLPPENQVSPSPFYLPPLTAEEEKRRTQRLSLAQQKHYSARLSRNDIVSTGVVAPQAWQNGEIPQEPRSEIAQPDGTPSGSIVQSIVVHYFCYQCL
jgi:hypothetical protein